VAVKIKGLDHVYARPGANLSQYDKVMLDPVEISFSKSWKPDRAGGPITAAQEAIHQSSTRVYALSVGEMRLVAELRDGSTGALIARVVDFKKDPDAPWLHLTTRVDNVVAARRAIADWAQILRRQLDTAHGLKE